MKTSDMLYAAADYIRLHGWRKNWYGEHLGPRCMIGACASAAGSDAGGIGMLEARLKPALECVVGNESALAVIDFNDDHCKTANDAIAALEIAADIACAEGN